ncbi:MAG: hypothetical protein GXO92_01145 [FCB group bacterium]|nr:hypothetical protein [FCB group bacterium]
MKRPSMYRRHEQSLREFVDRFNGVKDGLPLVMQIYHTENYRDDGVIVDTRRGSRIVFDWEIREKYFQSGQFRFSEVGQFERKLKKGEIGLSLQCDCDQTSVLVVWHADLLKEKPKEVVLKTDHPQAEQGRVRYTPYFKIYPYSDLKALRAMLHRAIRSGTFDHTVF